MITRDEFSAHNGTENNRYATVLLLISVPIW